MTNKRWADGYYDTRWHQVSERIKNRDGWKCQLCLTDQELVVDHGYYETGKEVWEYPDWSLTTVCKSCNKMLRYRRLEIQQYLAQAGPKMVLFLAGLLHFPGNWTYKSVFDPRVEPPEDVSDEEMVSATDMDRVLKLPSGSTRALTRLGLLTPSRTKRSGPNVQTWLSVDYVCSRLEQLGVRFPS